MSRPRLSADGSPALPEIGLTEVVHALRAELEEAMSGRGDSALSFTATKIELEFKVGVQRTAEGRGGIRFWVLELGGRTARMAEEVQTVKLTLDPILASGGPVRITHGHEENPLGANQEGVR